MISPMKLVKNEALKAIPSDFPLYHSAAWVTLNVFSNDSEVSEFTVSQNLQANGLSFELSGYF